jgi:glycosyltransferase involved in cell wall biosynthesis
MRRGFPNPVALGPLLKHLRLEQPRILQSWLYHADLLGLIAGKWSGVPCIAWNVRCSDMEMQRYSLLSAIVVRLLAALSRFPDMAIVNSEAGRRFHEKKGYRPRRWEVIPNGFDLTNFRPQPERRARFRAEIGLSENTFLIGLVARYDPMKDHRTFLQAGQYLLKEYPAVHFILVGRAVDDQNNELNQTIHDLKMASSVHLLGEQSDLSEIMSALDIFSLASAFGEGFPNVIGEAMACGVPCVATDVGDSASIIGETGRVVPPRNPHALAAAWRELIKLDPAQRGRLGRAARCRIEERYGLPEIIRRYEERYQELSADVRF